MSHLKYVMLSIPDSLCHHKPQIFVTFWNQSRIWLCGSVGRIVAFDTRSPRFESGQLQTFLLNICLKRGREWPIFFKKRKLFNLTILLIRLIEEDPIVEMKVRDIVWTILVLLAIR